MFRLRRPTPAAIQRSLELREEAPFSYPEVGVTRDGGKALPPSLRNQYDVDRYEVVLGSGPELFARARAALFAWAPFDLRWLELFGASEPVAEGRVVASLARAAGLWSLNPCRVVYVQDEDPGRAAWAYGTLGGHVEVGEERFQVIHDPVGDEVLYEVLAVSRPGHLLAQLGYPFARRVQERFRVDSAAAMQHATRGADPAAAMRRARKDEA